MIWKYIEDTNEQYSVSNTGLIRSNYRVITDSLGRKTAYPERILQPQINEYGYYSIKLSSAFGQKRFLVHRLVAQAFIPNPHNKPEVNHIDSNTSNSDVSNLEWATHKENMEHASEQGRMWNSTITEEQQELIKLYSLQKFTQNQIAKLVGVDSKTVNIYAQKFGVNNSRIISDEVKNEIKALYESGKSRKDISKIAGINDSTLSKIFMELGIVEELSNDTKNLIGNIQSLAATGMSQIDISRQLKISKNTVGKYIKFNL